MQRRAGPELVRRGTRQRGGEQRRGDAVTAPQDGGARAREARADEDPGGRLVEHHCQSNAARDPRKPTDRIQGRTPVAGILSSVGVTSERRRTWRSAIALACHLSRRTGKVIEARTLDIGPGGMRITRNRPLAPDELLEFELPERARINGRARVLREQGYRVYALRFEKLGDEARAEIAELASGSTTPPAPAR